MRKFLLLPALIVSFFLAAQGTALASGYSMAVLYDEAVILAKFSDSYFNQSEANTYSQLISSQLENYLPEAYVFSNQDLGDPDDLRSVLQKYTDSLEIVFIEVSKGESRFPSQGPNIWLDIWYDNSGMYVGSFGFSEMFAQFAN